MDGLVVAELRKVASTKLWWALLLPAAAVALAVNIGGAAVARLPESAADGGGTPPIVLFTTAFGLSFATIFAVTHGVIGSSGEYRHRTVTTTFLTASTRGDALRAKFTAFAAVGLLYGVVVVLAGLLGALIGSGTGGFGDTAGLLAIGGIGVLAMALWTLLGVGLGALVSNQVAAVVGTLVYLLVVEGLASLLLNAGQAGVVAAYLPSNAGDVMLYGLAAEHLGGAGGGGGGFAGALSGVTELPPWWVGAVVLCGYVAAFAAVGWYTSRARDIT